MPPSTPLRTNSLLQSARDNPVQALWLVFTAIVLVIYGLPLLWLVSFHLKHGIGVYPLEDRDFANYWTAAVLVNSGQHALLFQPDAYYAQLQSLVGESSQQRSWSYPPHFLLLVWPLGFLSYRASMFVFLAVTFIAFAAAVAAFRREFAPEVNPRSIAIALTGYVILMIAVAQNGFVTGALSLFALAWMRARPAAAGFALAMLTIKPQLGFLFPLLAVMDRNWRLLLWGSVFSIGLVGLSLLLFGISSWQAFFEVVLPAQMDVMTRWTGSFLDMMPSTFGSLRSLGASTAIAWQAHVAVAALTLAMVIWFWMRAKNALDRAFMLAAGTLTISPYSFNYDMGTLCVCAMFVALRADARRSRAAAVAIALLTVLPPVLAEMGRFGAPIAPIALLAGMIAMATVVVHPATMPENESS